MSRPAVFHIVTTGDWDAAQAAGTYTPQSLVTQGFVHLSYREQVAATAARYYGDAEDLAVVEFDPNLLDGELVDEDSTGSGERFPHFYAAVPTSAARAVHPLRRDEAGNVVFPG